MIGGGAGAVLVSGGAVTSKGSDASAVCVTADGGAAATMLVTAGAEVASVVEPITAPQPPKRTRHPIPMPARVRFGPRVTGSPSRPEG